MLESQADRHRVNRRPFGAWLAFTLAAWLAGSASAATSLPSGFVEESIGGGWNEAVGLAFAADGRMFVWERAGKVWTVENGAKSAAPFLDISEEVAVWNNYGLLGFCLHPDFTNNGFVYLLYTADRHHIRFFGTPNYNPSTTETHVATVGRITRFTARSSDGFRSIDPTSRKVLLGEAFTNGFPLVAGQHGVGSILFGSDGTLLASCGDGASSSITDIGNGSGTYYQQALADGIIQPKENVGAYRCQLVDGLNGKIVRLDAATGDGVPGNPFYDPASPRAARSRVWALGLKTPCRLTLRPGTGSHHPADANPGVLYIGDVGWNDWEDLNVCNRPGMNFGWPAYEGMEIQPSYYNSNVQNLDAPNPLFGIGGCSQPYFYFRDLIRQETLGTPSWPNPCNPAEQIPASIPRFVHARPAIDWKHGSGPARTPSFSGTNASVVTVGATGSPVLGSSFGGACSIGGTWYSGTDFPAPYRNTYFHADYVGEWIKNFVFDTNDAPVEVRNFATGAGGVVFLATHPVDGSLCYITWTSTLRKVRYVGAGNQPPTAVASLDRSFGPAPLTVQFTGTNSIDPERLPLTYLWRFGDGTPDSTNASPLHVFNALAGVPTRFDVTLIVTDRSGATNVAPLIVSANNTPPSVRILSPAYGTLYPTDGDSLFDCIGQVSDAEHDASQLRCAWQTVLHHNSHVHTEPVDNNCVTTAILSPEGCDGQSYYYSVFLTVTDAAGLSATNEVRLYPDCPPAPLDPARPPAGNFDLSHWYLTLPDSSATVIPPSTLVAGYTNNPWFQTGPDGAMVFWCPVTGGTTANSSYPRSELRERINPLTDSVNWSAYGTHILDAQCKVSQIPSTGKVIIGQIHSYTGNAYPLLKLQYANGLLDALVKDSPNSSSDTHYTFSTVPLNGLITYQIKVVDGLLSITVNGVTQSVNVFQTDPDWANQTFYFKAGSYCQDNSGSVTEGARVEFYFLRARHPLVVSQSPSISIPPANQTVYEESTVTFSAIATGASPLSYQWRKNGTPLPAEVSPVLTLSNVRSNDAAAYTLVVSNSFGAVTSVVARLTVNPLPRLNLQPRGTNGGPNAQVLVPIRVTQFTGIQSLQFSMHWNPAVAGLLGVEQFGVTGLGSSNVDTNAADTGTATVSWADAGGLGRTLSDGATLFALRFLLLGPVGSGTSLSLDGAPIAISATLANGTAVPVTVVPGALTIGVQPPGITTQPQSRGVVAGTNVSFSVAVTGSAPLSFQWRCNGTNLTGPGATSSTLTLSNVQAAQSGVYSVVVSNIGGVLISSNALLTVSLPLADALDSPGATWTTNGTPPWIGQGAVTHDGVDAAQSGAIGDGKSAYFQTTIVGPRTVSFWWKVSSETNKDLLLFAVGGTEQARISGEVDWQFRAFNVGSGNQTLRWTYLKNSSGVKGLDRGWVDQVRFTPDSPPAAPGALSATAVSNSRIDLRWTNNAIDATGILIERSSNGVAFSRIATLASNATTYANTGVLAGVASYYRVAASNVAGVSAYSPVAVATTPGFTAIRINFQPASAPVPPGYLVDSGATFGNRLNGLAYGWNVSNTSNTKDRNSSLSPDQRYDTFLSSQKTSGSKWDVAVPNGTYEVLMVAGDPTDASGDYRFTVEGRLAMSARPVSTNPWVTARITVPVTDGRLTISNAPGASNNRLCFLDISRRLSTFGCAPDKSASLDDAWSFDNPAPQADACGGTQLITIGSTVTNTAGLCGKSFRATCIWIAIDSCGNTNTCSQTVTVLDGAPPTMACAPARTVEWGVPWTFDIPTASDLADGTNVTVAMLSTITNSLCGNTFAVTRTWSATDVCGNSNTCSQTISVVDTTPPALACVPPRDVEWGTSWSFDDPATIDLVDGSNVTLAILSTTTNALCGNTFFVTRTWSATDACGNSNMCSQTITLVDTTLPSLTCSPSRVVEAGSPWAFDEPAASDAVDGTNVTVAILSTTTNALCGATFEATRIWSATDACGNSNTCSQTITIVDTTPPSLTCFASGVVEAGAPWAFEEPVAFDSADGTNVTVAILSTATNALCGGTFEATRTWSASDACGNSNTCSQTIILVDTTPPSLTCFPSGVVEAGSPWAFDEPVAFDSADGTNVTVAILSTATNALCGGTLEATRIWSATDVCGNSNTCSQTVTVIDTLPPALTCAASGTIPSGSSWAFENPVVFDLADGTNATLVILSTTTNAHCGNAFTATRIWMATDACGNFDTCSQTVDVTNAGPSLVCAPSGDVGTSWDFQEPVAFDFAGAPVTVIILSTTTNVHCAGTYSATRTWSATDACGNSNTCTQTYTAVDSIAPEILCSDIVTCDPSVAALPSVVDANDPAPMLACVRSDSQLISSPFPVGVTTVTCTASDACGNSSLCTFTVTVLEPVSAAGLDDQSVASGAEVRIPTSASGAGPLTYVWRFNGTVIDGATGDTLTLSNVQPGDSGLYCVEIVGACSAVTNCMTLSVLDP